MGNETSKPTPAVEKQRKLNKFVEGLEKNEIHLTESEVLGQEHHEEEPEDMLDSCGSASIVDMEKLKEICARKCVVLSPLDTQALEVNPFDMEYPFENLIMEGGGNKGLAYCGAIKCLEDLGMMSQIKRIGGTSAGALTAGLLAVGYNADEVLDFLSGDLESVFLDHSCGYFSLLPNLVRHFGWNPGNKIQQWLGEAIEKKTGNADTTFDELYQLRGIELCVVVTNLNLMTAEYCHPKTTPDMPIKIALRMTMSIPGMFSAMKYNKHGQSDVFVDGGVLANYPINCFDGWYLSMERKDAFLLKLKPLKDLSTLMSSNNRFKQNGPNKTMGFLLFADAEKEIMRFNLEKRIGAIQPKKPSKDTKLFKDKETKKKNRQKCERDHAKIVEAVESFFSVVQDHNTEDEDFISKEELRKALEDERFCEKHREMLFGKDCDLDEAFDILDQDKNDRIAFRELMQFVEERGIRMQIRFQGYDRRPIDTLGGFVQALSDTLLTNLKFVAVTHEDEDRTVGINTGHVGTNDYVLEEEDRVFIAQRGYNATLSFLRYYAVKFPDLVKKREQNGSILVNGHFQGISTDDVEIKTDHDDVDHGCSGHDHDALLDGSS